MSKKKQNEQNKTQGKHTPTLNNKKARFNYHLLEKLEAGIALVGTEVKSLRQGKATLEEAYCRIRGGELFLIGCNISPYEYGNIMNHEPTRPRKLLVHKRELIKIETKLKQKGLTLVPTRIYFNRGKAKLEVALAQGKTFGDKRQNLKERQAKMDVKRAMKKYR